MTRTLGKMALVVATATFGAGCFNFDNPAENQQQGSIRGQLVSSDSSTASSALISRLANDATPVVGASCTLEGTNKSATTDDKGVFELTKVPVGSYILICRAGERAFLATVEVKAKQVTDLGTAEITPTGRIQGTAKLVGTTDFSGIAVQILGTSIQATTDASGAYAIPAVPKGTYTVRFEKTGYAAFELKKVSVTPRATTLLGDVSLTLSTGPNGTLVIEGGAAIVAKRDVTLTISASSDAALMILSESDSFLNATWEPIAPTKAWLFKDDGLRRIYAKLADANGLESPPTSAGITVDTLPPSGTVGINGGATAVSSTHVTLTLAGSDATTTVTDMMVGNDEGLTGATWEPFATTRSWDLAPGDGTKSVFVKLKDAAGNVMPVASTASILLDTVAPTEPHIAIQEGATATALTIHLALSASGATRMKIGEAADLAGSTWVTYASAKTFMLSSGNGTKQVYAKFSDDAGNESETVSASIVLDAPAGTEHFFFQEGTDTAQRLVHLQLTSYAAVEMKISEDPTMAGATSVPFSTSATWNLSSGDGGKTVYVAFKHVGGNWTSPVSQYIHLDTTGPTGSVVINGGDAKTSVETVTLSLYATDAHTVMDVCISTDGTFADCTWRGHLNGVTQKVTFSAHANDNTATLTAHVKFRDNLGNVSKDYTASINLERNIKSGVLSGSETWIPGVPYVIKGDVGVPAELTLTLEPGVEVQFAGPYKILVKGAIVANGAPTNKIKLTATPDLAFSEATQLQFDQANLTLSQLSNVVFEKARNPAFPTGYGHGAAILLLNSNCSAPNSGMLTLSNAEARAPLLSYSCDAGVLLALEGSSVSDTLFEGEAIVKTSTIERSRLNVGSTTFSASKFSDSRIMIGGFLNALIRLEKGSSLVRSVIEQQPCGYHNQRLNLSRATLTNAYINAPGAQADISDTVLTYDGAYVPEDFGLSDFKKYRVRIGSGALSFSSLSDDSSTGVGLDVAGSGTQSFSMSFTDVTTKDVGVVFSGFVSFSVTSCNLRGGSYALENLTKASVDAKSNYWGAASESAIRATIYDGLDNMDYGIVDYSGFLATPVTGTGPRP